MTGNGHVIPGTPIAIDMWNRKKIPQARIFFLSHFHGDHIVGLTNSWEYPIYASPITCKFLIHKIKLNPSLVISLEIGEDHLIPLDLEGREMLTVTLFDANHCPGSVMFLLSGYFGDILYTGDFRYHPNIFDNFPISTVDVLYLDNTYCSPRCVFPTRDIAIERISSQLHACLAKSDRVFLGLDNLGKEDLLLQIAKETQSKICVKPSRKETMDILGLSDIVTTDESNTKIFVVATNQISGKNIALWNKEKKTQAILATARFSGLQFQPFKNHPDIHVIPYSNHSSFSELKEFVRQVKPCSIVPIVGKQAKGIFGSDISDRADMSIFQKFLQTSPPPEYIIPESIQKALNLYKAMKVTSLKSKRRKVAKKVIHQRKKHCSAGIQYMESEDSETESDHYKIHSITKTFATEIENLSEYSSSSDSEQWEVTHISGMNHLR